MSDPSPIIKMDKPFVGIVPRETIEPSEERVLGFMGPLPKGEFWFTIKVKPDAKLLRLYQHLGEGKGREAPIVFDKLKSGLRELSWVLGDIMEEPTE
jgi:hypothetical protein